MEKIIWSLWWQGEENAPPIVQMCLRSIRKHAGDIQVNVLNKNTYQQYVNLPDYMLEKVKEGKITLTHLSDIIRVHLLRDYGGLWLDSTIFVARDIPAEIFDREIFTLPYTVPSMSAIGYVTQGRYTGFCIGANEGNPLFIDMCEFFDMYWMNNSEIIDYLLIDFALRMCSDRHPQVLLDLESLPKCDTFNFLADHIDDGATQLILKDVFYKLSYKWSFHTVTPSGENTYLSCVAGGYGIELCDTLKHSQSISKHIKHIFLHIKNDLYSCRNFGFEIAFWSLLNSASRCLKKKHQVLIQMRLYKTIFKYLRRQPYLQWLNE